MDGTAIAVTVVGGYLGAGKTTLVNHLLSVADERVAVLVNDFGEINIDAALIESTDGETISLSNGCICCSLVDGLASALADIAALDPRPERLVIEASGVADPAGVAAFAHRPGFVLDAVVVVVDAELVRAQASDRYVGDTVLSQLAAADLLIVNKTDLIAASELETRMEWLAARAPNAALVEAVGAVVPLTVLLGPADSPARQPPDAPNGRTAGDVFETWAWTSSEPVGRQAVEKLMAELPSAVIRVKGTLARDDDPDRGWVLQRVGQRWTLEPSDARPPHSRVVAIAVKGTVAGDVLAEHLRG